MVSSGFRIGSRASPKPLRPAPRPRPWATSSTWPCRRSRISNIGGFGTFQLADDLGLLRVPLGEQRPDRHRLDEQHDRSSGRLREGARSYAKRFAVADGSAPGQRYSPVRLMCSQPSGETWARSLARPRRRHPPVEVGDQVKGAPSSTAVSVLWTRSTLSSMLPPATAPARAGAASRRRPLVQSEPALGEASRADWPEPTAGADSSAFRMSP